MSKFIESLKIGTIAEQLVVALFCNHGYKASFNKNNELIKYDITCSFGTIEVKYDLYEAKSGNVAVEFWNTKLNKPSGISATTSKIWSFVLADKSIWFCNTEILKNYCNDVKPYRIISCGGDQNSSMKLYKRHQIFNDIFHRVDLLSKEEFDAIINKICSLQGK